MDYKKRLDELNKYYYLTEVKSLREILGYDCLRTLSAEDYICMVEQIVADYLIGGKDYVRTNTEWAS